MTGEAQLGMTMSHHKCSVTQKPPSTQKIEVVEKTADIKLDNYDSKVHTETIKEDLWDKWWSVHQEKFNEALQSNDVEGAHKE